MESCLPIHKEGSKKDCSNYKGTSVRSVMSRLYGKILRNLIEEENKDEEEQTDSEQEDHVQIISFA
jgi:hypothetical protein